MRPWSAAWASAADLFWAQQSPSDHFRTSAGDEMALCMLTEAVAVDKRLGHPAEVTVLDVGAGDGELLRRMRDLAPPGLADRLRLVGVDLRPSSDDTLDWVMGTAPDGVDLGPVIGLVMAHEWLDEIPCDVVECDAGGVVRLVLVGADGAETLGPPLAETAACAEYDVDALAASEWVETWWPLRVAGERAEVGIARDRAWQWLAGLVLDGVALATDYGHTVESRRPTLVGYRQGRLTAPRPDGTVNLTAHVSVDSCAAQVPGSTLHTQREMLRSVTPTPGPEADGPARALALARASTVARLRDPLGPGAFRWLRVEQTS
jgi:hypothetical protein